MKKNFDMSDLVNELTTTNEVNNDTEKDEQQVKSNKKVKKVTEPICTLVDKEQIAKIRTIAERERVSLKDLFAVALDMVVSSYEEKYGVIRIKQPKKGNVKEIFGK